MNYDLFGSLIIKELLPVEWLKLIDSGVIDRTQQRLERAINFAQKERVQIFPHPNDIFRVLKECLPERIKVVIFGQDPYHSNPRQANGIAFSVSPGVAIPPSLRNMFVEIQQNYPGTNHQSGDLNGWLSQGVFLMNAALTVLHGQPGSHMPVWNEFTDEIIRVLQNTPKIYCLWGRFAEAKGTLLSHPKNIVLKCSHPSPLSAHKTETPFRGLGIFKLINQHAEPPIDWST
jgi:uracil-DNA glycosylase